MTIQRLAGTVHPNGVMEAQVCRHFEEHANFAAGTCPWDAGPLTVEPLLREVEADQEQRLDAACLSEAAQRLAADAQVPPVPKALPEKELKR